MSFGENDGIQKTDSERHEGGPTSRGTPCLHHISVCMFLSLVTHNFLSAAAGRHYLQEMNLPGVKTSFQSADRYSLWVTDLTERRWVCSDWIVDRKNRDILNKREAAT